jgi:serine/threonine-protein kinase RIO1
MVYDGKAYLIDFGQAVPREHPMSWEFLKRDVVNILRFFKKAGLNVPEEEAVLEWLKK